MYAKKLNTLSFFLDCLVMFVVCLDHCRERGILARNLKFLHWGTAWTRTHSPLIGTTDSSLGTLLLSARPRHFH